MYRDEEGYAFMRDSAVKTPSHNNKVILPAMDNTDVSPYEMGGRTHDYRALDIQEV